MHIKSSVPIHMLKEMLLPSPHVSGGHMQKVLCNPLVSHNALSPSQLIKEAARQSSTRKVGK